MLILWKCYCILWVKFLIKMYSFECWYFKMRQYTLSLIMNQNALLWLRGGMNYVHLWLFFFLFSATSMHHLVDSMLVAPYSSEVVHHSDEDLVLKSLLQGDLLLIPYPSNQSILCWSMLVCPFITCCRCQKRQFLVYSFGRTGGMSTKIIFIICLKDVQQNLQQIKADFLSTVTWVKL